MSRTDLVIFDCDGVLVDSEPISNRVWCQCLRTLGWDLDDAASHEMFVGRSMADCVRLVEARLGRIFSAADVPRGKPHPDLFLHAATSLGTPPTRCVVVEDSVPGVRAAIAAGMRALGYARSANAAALTKAGAEVFDDMAQLPMLVR